MSKQAFIFPGQGSQIIGMGKAVYDSFTEAKEVFQEVDDALNQKLSEIIFNGEQETLTLTENAQPALMVTSIAILRVLQKQSGKQIDELCDFVAGHSLGEYTALCAAESLSLNQTAKLLKLRGKAMQEAVPKGVGGMAAVIGLSFEDVEKLCLQASEASGEPCELANDNSDGQVVISGSLKAIEKGEEIAKFMKAKRYLKLPVSAPFHSSMIKKAQDAMFEALEEEQLNAPKIPLIANVTAKKTSESSEIKELLVKQVTGRVRWRESVAYMANELEVIKTVEIGAGKVLSSLVRRIAKEVEVINIETPEDIEKIMG